MTTWTAAVLVGVVIAGCSGPAEPGVVSGFLPACYGPGPNMNLKPNQVVTARQDGVVVKSQSFRSDRDHQHYELTLPPGRYEISVPWLPPIRAEVRSGAGITADLVGPACA